MRRLALLGSVGLLGLASCTFESVGESDLFACGGGYCNASGVPVAVTSGGSSSGGHKSSSSPSTSSSSTSGTGSSSGTVGASSSAGTSSGGSSTGGISSGSSSSTGGTSTGGSSSGSTSGSTSGSSSSGSSSGSSSSGGNPNCGNFSNLTYYFTGNSNYASYVIATGQLSGTAEASAAGGTALLADIVTGDEWGGTVPPIYAGMSAYLNQGLGVFPTQGTFYEADAGGAQGYPIAIAVGDFNSDQKGDVALTVLGNAIAVYYNQGLGFFPATPSWLWGSATDYWLGLVTADVDQDGQTDLVAAGENGFAVFRGGDGGLSSTYLPYAPSQSLGGGYAQVSFVTADFNGDGWPDVASLFNKGNDIGVFLNDAGSYPATPLLISDPAEPSGLAVGDFNHDGRPDLAVSSTNNSVVSLFLNQGGGLFGGAIDLSLGGSVGGVLAADFNGDGWSDLAVLGDTTVTILINQTDGGFAPGVSYAAGTCPMAFAADDFNGDGLPDLAIGQGCDGDQMAVLLNACP